MSASEAVFVEEWIVVEVVVVAIVAVVEGMVSLGVVLGEDLLLVL